MSQMFCIDIFLIASVTNVKSWFELLQVSCQAACAILCEELKLRCLSKADNTPKGAHGLDHSWILFSICKNTLLFLWLETWKHNSENKNNSTQLHTFSLCHFLKKVIFLKELFKSYFSLKSKKKKNQ